jgi:hypothetical protein
LLRPHHSLNSALVLVRLDDVASFIVNANHCIVRTAVELGVADCVQDCVPAPHRDDGKPFVVRADEKLTAFLELELVTRACGELS